jgi:hypothetical protein
MLDSMSRCDERYCAPRLQNHGATMMKTSTQQATGDQKSGTQKPSQHHSDEHASQEPSRSLQEESAPLPHEADQTPESQHEHAPRGVGKQAHRDLERGLQDTDRRGGDDYQERTQNDTHANRNSQGEGSEGRGGSSTARPARRH